MYRKTPLLFLMFLLTSCDVWGLSAKPYPLPSLVPTYTPPIFTATPIIIYPPTINATFTASATPSALIPAISETPLPTLSPTSIEPTPTDTQSAIQSVAIEILGCNTSFDIRNGMYEVTNAYVILKNTGTVDLPNTCGLLRANDEGREHPDKKVCVENLPTRNQVTLKLTVDSTYKEDTIIQVDAISADIVLLRIDKQSCRDIKIFGGVPADVGTIKPIP